jgi:xanthine dehydrogenase accessory factor
MVRHFLDRVAALRREGQRFATATVVGRRAPVSAHLGDRAIVYPDGRMEGFIGGACSREIVRRQALECLRAGHARLVSIRPDAMDPDARDPEHVTVRMTCVSEGAVDVYVEPVLPARRLIVVGSTPVADALTRTAATLDYDVVRVVDDRERPDLAPAAEALGVRVVSLAELESVVQASEGQAAAVVASQGHYDERALETILRGGAAYVGLVASRTRGASVKQLLEDGGVPDTAAIRSPAGLDLGARTPPEVALSILAEIVRERPAETLDADASRTRTHEGSARSSAPHAAAPQPEPAAVSHVAVDPVCQMEVEMATATQTALVEGITYYFCCAHCRAQFVKDPASFAASPR